MKRGDYRGNSSTWSRARRGPLGAAHGPIRSSQHILGLPHLPEPQASHARIGNTQVRNTCQIIKSCVSLGVPCSLENPRTSLMWQHPALVRLLSHDSCSVQNFDQCQYGTRWKKATSIALWNCGHQQFINKTCTGRKGTCSQSGLPHIVLCGYSKIHKKPWTAVAQKYPQRLVSLLCDRLILGCLTGLSSIH